CRVPSGDCDLDHTVAVQDGGPTTENNLAPLCRHHHRAKHQAPWRYQQTSRTQHTFTSPLGHTYITSGRSP
ncbi:MAG: HNH endonuclease signature motif containing protein, partial [Actinobacteria bacterium]|nr:HNH endonuclease signature motif containing protein [Actinomycetota bacterium]